MIEIRKVSSVTSPTDVQNVRPEWDVLVLRDGKPVAVLPHGSPLRRTLTLTARELRSIVDTFPTIMEEQPRIKALLQALIEYKEERAISSQRA